MLKLVKLQCLAAIYVVKCGKYSPAKFANFVLICIIRAGECTTFGPKVVHFPVQMSVKINSSVKVQIQIEIRLINTNFKKLENFLRKKSIKIVSPFPSDHTICVVLFDFENTENDNSGLFRFSGLVNSPQPCHCAQSHSVIVK
jgi:hypothetical protein